MLPVVTPIALEVAGNLIPLVEGTADNNKFLGEMVPMMRDGEVYVDTTEPLNGVLPS